MASTKVNWQTEELNNWTSSVCGLLLPGVLWGFIFRIYVLYFFNSLPWSKVVQFTVFFFVCLIEHEATAHTSRQNLKLMGCHVYVELMQLYVYAMAISADPDYIVYYAITSTVFCLNYQITLFSSSPGVVFYVFKQFLSWMLISLFIGQLTVNYFFPYMPFLLMITLSIKNTKHRQKLAMEKGEYCNSLITQEKRLESVMAAIPDGMLVITDMMELKTWNEELVILLGAKQTEESLKDTIRKLTYDGEMKRYESENASLWMDILQFIDSTQSSQTFGTTFLLGRNLEWKGSRCKWDQSKACILTVRDSTDWINMQEKTKRESASKTALLRSVSHELRTPTHAIINLVREVLEDSELTPLSKEDLTSVRVCSCFLLSMINDLLDYSQVLAGQFTLVKTNFNLEQEIQQSVQLFESQCRAKSLDLVLNIDPLLPVLANSDPNRMKQVLLNLLSNAVK